MRWANGLLVIATVAVTYLLAEAAFALVGLRYVPLRLHADLPPDVRDFAQSSKRAVLPRDPVVLLGDSYAQGAGDWLLEADPHRNGPFHSAHVIHALTGRDVVTFGIAGASNVEGLAALPVLAYARTRLAWHLRMPPPALAIVYFYEGNDLTDNITLLERRVGTTEAVDADRIDRVIAAVAHEYDIARRHRFPLFRFCVRIVRRIYAERSGTAATQERRADAPAAADGLHPPNLVEVAGQAVALPWNLQSPALELTDTELVQAALVFERSLAFLRKLFPGTPVLVAYLPAPLSSYQLPAPEVTIANFMKGRPARYPQARVATYSDAICDLIRTASVRHGAGFLDVRPAIRAAGARTVVHGPRDDTHFNRIGMEALGRVVAERIDRPEVPEACSHAVSEGAAGR